MQKIKACQSQIAQLIQSRQEMDKIDGIHNRVEEEKRIETVKGKIERVVERKKAKLKEMRQQLKTVYSEWHQKEDFQTQIGVCIEEIK